MAGSVGKLVNPPLSKIVARAALCQKRGRKSRSQRRPRLDGRGLRRTGSPPPGGAWNEAQRPNATEHFLGVSLRMLFIFDRGVFELARRDRDQMERLGDRQGGNLGTDLLGEEDALLDGFGGEVRPVSRDQDVFEQYSSPPVSASF
jgi:hypothetical protein